MGEVQADASDIELWSLVREGDHLAFAAMYRRHWAAVARHLSRRVPPAEVEDLLSTVFMEAWRQRLQVSILDARGLLPWLYVVSRNCAARHLERQHRERAATAASVETESTEDLANVLADIAEHEWRVERARRALASLSDADQEILDLCLTDGLTPSEAARTLGIEPVAARSRLHRARSRLAAAFTEITSEEAHHE